MVFKTINGGSIPSTLELLFNFQISSFIKLQKLKKSNKQLYFYKNSLEDIYIWSTKYLNCLKTVKFFQVLFKCYLNYNFIYNLIIIKPQFFSNLWILNNWFNTVIFFKWKDVWKNLFIIKTINTPIFNLVKNFKKIISLKKCKLNKQFKLKAINPLLNKLEFFFKSKNNKVKFVNLKNNIKALSTKYYKKLKYFKRKWKYLFFTLKLQILLNIIKTKLIITNKKNNFQKLWSFSQNFVNFITYNSTNLIGTSYFFPNSQMNLLLMNNRMNFSIFLNFKNIQSLRSTKKKFKFQIINDFYPSSFIINILLKYFSYFYNNNIILNINFELYNNLTIQEIVFLESVNFRMKLFAFQFSTIFFLSEFIDVVYLSLKRKNLKIIFYYIQRILKKLILWDHKKFLLFFFNLFSEQFFPKTAFLGFKGIKLVIKGKIAVGGNSRKRSMILKLGKTTASNHFNDLHITNTLFTTSTGALGFKAWLFY